MTAQSVKTGIVNPDTVRCYGVHELQKIAATMIKKHACDTLLSTAKTKLSIQDTIIKDNDKQISDFKLTNKLQQVSIDARDTAIQSLTDKYNKKQRNIKFLKFGWASTTVILGGTILYLIFTH